MTTLERSILVKQGKCSVKTHHVALLIVPQDTTWPEDITHADVYGVDDEGEENDVLSLPDCWVPAGTIDGGEFARLSDDETCWHDWS